MDLTRTAYGAWNGGRFMHLGEPVAEERYLEVVQHAYQRGIRTFITSDIYGNGAADELLGRALAGWPRKSYCLVGAIGHDFYSGHVDGSKGVPRFTHPNLRPPNQYAAYIQMATERALERCQTDHFDLLLLHNPDSAGFASDAVWKGMARVQEAKLTERLGLAPGPAHGYPLDIILCLERFGPLLDWMMLILNPLEPWPGALCMPAAVQHEVQLIARGVDYGGLFHDEVKPGHAFGPQDSRAFRPDGWVESGLKKIEQMRDLAQCRNLTMIQLAGLWCLSQPAVQCIVPTLIQETKGKPLETQVDELASLPEIKLTSDELGLIAEVGDNKGCMVLKGADRNHLGVPESDRWGMTAELEAVGKRWSINPDQDLICTCKTAE